MAELRLDELRVLPTGQAWHKTRPLTPAHHRLAMAEGAMAGALLAHMLTQSSVALQGGTWLARPRALAPFSLTDTDGTVVPEVGGGYRLSSASSKLFKPGAKGSHSLWPK